MENKLREKLNTLKTYIIDIRDNRFDDKSLDYMEQQLEELETLINKHYVRKAQLVNPDWEEVESWVGYILCTCGQTLQHRAETREHWQMGHFCRLKTNTDKEGE